jgi:nitrite reductase/ring-hydroxylating ferredoxin subunit/uncharacterized membrane protein
MLKALLQGKWFGQALHPYFVHLPIALYILSLLLDFASLVVQDGNPFVRAAFYTMAVATVAALLAFPSGLADWLDIRADDPAKQVGIYHMTLNFILIGIYGVNILLRWGGLWANTTQAVWLGMSIVGVGVLGLSGYFGGKMVYEHGVGVGRHRRRGKTPEETIRAPLQPPSIDMAPVVAADQLQENQTLRVEVKGVAIAIAKRNGNVHAFQDFCTHRYGPLSEGHFCDGKIVCPWHGSAFDMSSGKVADGPAKVDLRTFRTEIREGMVYVEVPEPNSLQQPSSA